MEQRGVSLILKGGPTVRRENQYIVVDSMTADEVGREIVRSRYTSLVRLRSEG